ncbi:MAG TPA: DNA alkylation repair protein [Cytophagaceae bacterium]|jgi:3-methyladenine DNA glycosylase AlkC|nr:DNA alkylation repair protein [Cytophagaceae bacterium]
MAEPLKNIYNKILIDEIASVLKKVYPLFDANRFTKLVFDKNWADKELKQRMRHLSEVLKQLLPEDFSETTDILIRCIEELKKYRKGEMYLEFMFFPDFIEVYGIDDYENSIRAFEKMTQFSSAEFGVRPFLIKYPEKMQQQMVRWASHPHAMVRRLASEGFRPRLPWAMAVPHLKKDPSLILPVLEKLKQDESESVRRSVANNLNDIAKEHPELVIQIASKWQGVSNDTDWIIRHGCRTLLKKGNKNALTHFGLTETKGISITELKTGKKKISIGNELPFSFLLTVKKKANLRLEYGIDYVKANGKTSRKIFKLREGAFEKGGYAFSKKQSFQNFTTRKHYPGKHSVAIIVNGEEKATVSFALTL